MGPRTRIASTITRLRRVEPRELVWGGILVMAFGWFVHVDDPLLAAAAIPVEIIATVAIVRPHIQSSSEPDGKATADRQADDGDDRARTADR